MISLTPEPPGLSLASSLTVTSALFQPFRFGRGVMVAVVVGGVESGLIPRMTPVAVSCTRLGVVVVPTVVTRHPLVGSCPWFEKGAQPPVDRSNQNAIPTAEVQSVMVALVNALDGLSLRT